MTKRINFALAYTPPVEPPVVVSLRLDGSKDVNIVLTKGDESLTLGYLCSDRGTLNLVDFTTGEAAKFGLQREPTSRKIKVL